MMRRSTLFGTATVAGAHRFPGPPVYGLVPDLGRPGAVVPRVRPVVGDPPVVLPRQGVRVLDAPVGDDRAVLEVLEGEAPPPRGRAGAPAPPRRPAWGAARGPLLRSAGLLPFNFAAAAGLGFVFWVLAARSW